jgi:hypothetical protein
MTQKPEEKPKTVVLTGRKRDLPRELSPREIEMFEELGKRVMETNRPIFEHAQRLTETLAPIIKQINNQFNSPFFQHFLQERARVAEQLVQLSKSVIIPELPKLTIFDREPVIFQRPISPEEIMLRRLDAMEGRILNQKLLPETAAPKQDVLRLDRFGKLYREKNPDWAYKFDEDLGRERLVRFLANYKTFHKANVLVKQSGIKTEKSVRDSIAIINKKARAKLHLEDKLIDSQHGSGYRLNPKYTIIHTEE